MNIFETATQIETKAKESMKGNRIALADTLVCPFFKGTMRRKQEGYKPVVKGNNALTGSFIMNYFSCLAYFVCKEGYTKDKKKIVPPLTVYVVAALIASEGFAESEFSRKRKGFAEIGASLKAFSEKENLNITIDSKTGVISGITEEIACKVLSYF